MRLAGLAMLVALTAGGASAQPDPTRTKPEITQKAEDAVKTSVSELGKDMKRDVRALQDDVQSEAEKDARADHTVGRTSKDAALGTKSAKLKMDNASIKDGMTESKDKADKAMTGANVQLQLGIVSGAQGVGGATGTAKGAGAPHVNDKVKDPAVKPCKDCTAPTKPHRKDISS